jgi:hypothetical protein
MVDAADDLTDEGLAALAAHVRGECDGPCPYCDEPQECSACGGSGDCPRCGGSGGGTDPVLSCSACRGSGDCVGCGGLGIFGDEP